MSDDQIAAAELHEVIQEYQEQLAAVATVIAEDPTNAEAQQIHAELQDALSTAQAAYAQYLPVSTTEASAITSNNNTAAAAAAAAVAATAARTAGAAAIPQPASNRQPRAGRTMHPDNIYCSQEPDFAALAQQHHPLAAYIIRTKAGRPALDFRDWHATKELTAALLKADFGVTWDLPEGQLVPPVPNRANYIHWVNDLLQLSSPQGDTVHGLDIGCGANLIYCLLGAAVYGWHMTGVDVTPVALQGAADLREANPQLAHLLEVRKSQCLVGQLPQQQQQYIDPAQQFEQQQQQQAGQEPHTAHHDHHFQQHLQHDADTTSQQQQQQQQLMPGPLLGALANSTEQFHFCMCNPPFFESLQEANQNPNTACGGTSAEMVCPGGELAFIRAMIEDSKELGGRVHWYSSMCGKKASLKVLRQELHSAGVTVLRTTELVQGKTSRWAIAWSFAANPNTANMPLPRRQQQQQQQQQQEPGRKLGSAAAATISSSGVQSALRVSFSVMAAAADGRKLLQSVAALLTAVGGVKQVQTDTSNWKIRCRLPADAAGSAAQQQQQQQQYEEAGNTSEPAAKRAKTTADSCTSSTKANQIVEVSVFQQRRGQYDIVASVLPATTSSNALVTALSAVRDDLALMWPVTELASL